MNTRTKVIDYQSSAKDIIVVKAFLETSSTPDLLKLFDTLSEEVLEIIITSADVALRDRSIGNTDADQL